MSLQPSLPSQCPSTNSGTQSNMHRSQHLLLFRGQNLWEHFSLFLSADGPEKEISSYQGTDDYLYRCKKITKFIGGYHSRPLLIVGLEGVLGITTVVVVQELGELTVAHLWNNLLARNELSEEERPSSSAMAQSSVFNQWCNLRCVLGFFQNKVEWSYPPG